MLKKFSFSYVKQHPVMFGVIVIVFGLIVYLLLNRGSGGGGGDVVYQSAGTDPAKLAAETQIAIASIQAGAQNQAGAIQLAALDRQIQGEVSIAAMQAQIAAASLGAEERLGVLGINASLEQSRLDAATARALQADALNFQLGYQANQNNMTLALSQQQADAFKLSSLLAIIPTLKKKNRDESLAFIASASMGVPQPSNTSGQATNLNLSPIMTIGGQGNPAFALPPPSIN